MKTHLLLFLFGLVIFEKSYSQTYEKFVIEGAQWRMNQTGCPSGCDPAASFSPNYNSTYWLKLEGDTIVNNVSYKKFYISEYSVIKPIQNYQTLGI